MITKERYAVLLKLEESANKQNIESITTSDIDKLRQHNTSPRMDDIVKRMKETGFNPEFQYPSISAHEDEFEVPDDATDEEIDEIANEAAFSELDFRGMRF